EVGRHINIELHTLSDLQEIQGEPGNFSLRIRQNPRYVDMDKCIACGVCAERCPVKVRDEFNQGLARRKAIYVPYSQAVPLKYAIDAPNCIYFKKGKCKACEKYCPTGAVNLQDQAQEVSLQVGSVIISSGFQPFDPTGLDTYQYSEFPNVLTSMEFERLLSATGPYQGHLVRPSDQQEPKKIAWLQCIGSRDINRCDRAYCSSVCCMYAIKEAVIAKEHSNQELDTAIFYMDLRTYGKDFEKYYERARDQEGVRFIRSRVHTIAQDQEQNLVLQFVDDSGNLQQETFDLVVLSVGMQTSQQMQDKLRQLGIELNHNNLVQTSSVAPVQTSRPGIYVCGSIAEPKDIPASVMEASAAACEAQVSLHQARGSQAQSKTFPQEKPVLDQEPRIGVFLCNCGVNIGGVVDIPSLGEAVRKLPNVEYVQENLFTCSQDTQDKIKEVIQEQGLNRVVVAACTPRTHEPLFQETLKDAGLNKYLFEMANIRNQCSWVHSKEKDRATQKAWDLVKMAVARASRIMPLQQPSIPVSNSALIIGGGVAGMTSALALAEQGFQTYLVEQGEQLGGNALHLNSTWQGQEIPAYLQDLHQRIESQPLVKVYTQAKITESTGFVGNFQSVVTQNAQSHTLEHGAVIIAVGAHEHQPQEYLYGQDERVVTHLELDRIFRQNPQRLQEAKSAVFIQCVGSREPERPYCSKVCCTHSIKSALALKEQNPEMNVFILYRDIRAYGQREELYKEARQKGVMFISYNLDAKPQVDKGQDSLLVQVRDHILQQDLEIQADLLVLASAIERPQEEELAGMFKLPLNAENFFMEAHAKLRPVEFATDGIFLAGLAHYPKPLEESISQAKAAASRAAVVLCKDSLTVEGIVSEVNEFLCRACGECVQACPYNAIELVTEQYRT
ncbi:MAG: FAD-dependent oxidoreductase, partial [Desulfohalobiaceae bacterium]